MSASDIEKNHGVGYVFPSQPIAYNQRDLLLYAAGVGATMDEPAIAYELDANWAPMPTYPVVLPFKGSSSDVVNFAQLMSGNRAVPGLPDTTKKGAPPSVHADQSIHALRPLPHHVDERDGWVIKRQLTGVHDNGKGLRIERTDTLVDGRGTEYARMVSTGYTAGDWQLGKFSKTIAPKAPAEPLGKPPGRQPDATITETPPLQASVTYRLSGDYNPLHIDPNVGKKMFGGTINHGLCAYGYAARHLITGMANGQPSRLTYLKARFASPVKPGDGLSTQMWKGDSLPNGGGQVVHFVQLNTTTGKPALGGGVAIISAGGSGNGGDTAVMRGEAVAGEEGKKDEGSTAVMTGKAVADGSAKKGSGDGKGGNATEVFRGETVSGEGAKGGKGKATETEVMNGKTVKSKL